jgi:hypothetical protein
MTSSQKDVVVQKTTIKVNKTKQSLKNTKNLRGPSMWSTSKSGGNHKKKKKITIKDGIQNSEEKITQNPKSQYTLTFT